MTCSGVRDQLANRSDKVVRESLGFLWQKWTRMERYLGDAGAVRKAVLFCNEEYRNLQRDHQVEEDHIVCFVRRSRWVCSELTIQKLTSTIRM